MLKIINKINLAIALALAIISGVNAQTVTVPSTCTVVNVGTGSGGSIVNRLVTDGGIVTMADNDDGSFNGGVFTLTDPAIETVAEVNWDLKGDLSSTPATVFPQSIYGSPTKPANGLNATIISYNKEVTEPENTAPSNARFARSFGKVTISYKVTNGTKPCGVTISFYIYKTITAGAYLPEIAANSPCVQPNVRNTFSVDNVASNNGNDYIGNDNYYWTGIPAGATSIGYSMDRASINFVPANDAEFTLKCCIGRANPWNGGTTPIRAGLPGTNCVTKTFGTPPVEPVFTTNPNALCVPTGAATSFTINYTSANTCNWTTPTAGWTNGTTTASSVTINTNGNNNPGTLFLDVISCKSSRFQYQINRSLTAPVIIAPVIAGNNCLKQWQGSTPNQFAISASAAANPITWTLTPSADGMGIQSPTPNSSTVNVYVATGPPVGIYTLTARTNACAGSSISYQFRVVAATETPIGGTLCVVRGALTPQTYTCANVSGSASYTWTFPVGWSAPSFITTTNQITVTPSSTNAVLNGPATVSASSTVGCTNQAFDINYVSVAPTGVLLACSSVGIAGTASVTIDNPQPGLYTAIMSSTAVGSTNVITSPVTVVGNTLSFSTSALSAGTYNLIISHVGSCSGIATTPTLVTVAGNGATVSKKPATNPTGDIYTAVAPSGMTSPQYEWTACTPAGGCTIIGGNTPTLTLSGTNTPPANSQICVTVFPSGSTCKTRVCIAQGPYSVMASNAKTGISIEDGGTTIYPNPNTSNFNIKIGDFKNAATATLYDFNGKKIKDFNLIKGINKIEYEKLSLGNYFIVLYIDGKKEAKQIVIK